MTTYRFIEPMDVLFLRGNRLFGEPGSHGESLVPPWPSVAAGAIRSLMLVAEGLDPAAFARCEIAHPTLGSPDSPGAFTLAEFQLARRVDPWRADAAVETLHEPPADLVVSGGPKQEALEVGRMSPTPVAAGLEHSCPLPMVPVLAQHSRRKAAGGWWLREAGWRAYLAGELPAISEFVHSRDLWALDARVGVGLEAARGRAEDGKLFSAQAVALKPGVGFLAGVDGAEPPVEGALRFGGDGRAAALSRTDRASALDFDAIAAAGRCRLVLTSPAMFERGWLPSGTSDSLRLELPGLRARLCCAAVRRAEWVSGFDLARRVPKPAQRVVPAGSVYWLDELETTAEALRKLVESGLWLASEHNSRRAEGFNRCTFAVY